VDVTGTNQRQAVAAGHRTMLVSLSGLLLVLTLLHDLDHVRQNRSLDLELYGVGGLAVLTTVTTLVLAVRRHRLADYAAVLLGISTVVGVAIVHVAPRRAALSDSYGAAHVDALSWLVILAMMATGAALAWVTASAIRRARRVEPPIAAGLRSVRSQLP
jgi:hypothetical protein